MFLRDAPTATLTDVRERLEDNTEVIQRPSGAVVLDLVDTQTLTFTDAENIVIPMDSDGISALGNWLEIPNKFLMRQQVDLQQHLLSTLLARTSAQGAFQFSREGLKAIRNPNDKHIEPRRIVDRVMRVMDPASPVTDYWNNDEFRLDVIVPEGFDRGIGGDPAVNDITRGGIRVGMDAKHNLAPWVQPFQYRLVCTNGMETLDPGLKIDARGASVEDVLAEFEAAADRAFRRVEGDIAAFYALRAERVANPERTLIRMAEERGLPTRTILGLAERVPGMEGFAEDGSASMFDLVNLITNAANDPRIRNRASSRRALEVTGGSIITEHASRCGACQSALSPN